MVNDKLSSQELTRYFGTRLTPISFDEWLLSIAACVASGARGHLSGLHNLHSLYLLGADDTVGKFYGRCDDCYIDGMAVRVPLALAGVATTADQRFSLMDTFPALLRQAASRNWTIFYLGSRQAVVDQSRQRLANEFPDTSIELHHGYFEDDAQLVKKINALRPDLLLVGMGMPRQEAWILENIDQLDVAVIAQAGATLDYFAGAQPKPPVWMSDLGLAWLFRLLNNPARLWRRYLLEPWGLLVPTLKLCLCSGRAAPQKPGGDS